MSIQRVLEVARRQNMPVVVTDVAGREPMVILPLASYEAMLDGRPSRHVSSEANPPEWKAPRESASSAPMKERVVAIEAMTENMTGELQAQVNQAMRDLTETPSDVSSGISMEERFYLEPVDEEGK